jgi:hypothetical protein
MACPSEQMMRDVVSIGIPRATGIEYCGTVFSLETMKHSQPCLKRFDNKALFACRGKFFSVTHFGNKQTALAVRFQEKIELFLLGFADEFVSSALEEVKLQTNLSRSTTCDCFYPTYARCDKCLVK